MGTAVKSGIGWIGSLMVAVMGTEFVSPSVIATAAGGALGALIALYVWSLLTT